MPMASRSSQICLIRVAAVCWVCTEWLQGTDNPSLFTSEKPFKMFLTPMQPRQIEARNLLVIWDFKECLHVSSFEKKELSVSPGGSRIQASPQGWAVWKCHWDGVSFSALVLQFQGFQRLHCRAQVKRRDFPLPERRLEHHHPDWVSSGLVMFITEFLLLSGSGSEGHSGTRPCECWVFFWSLLPWAHRTPAAEICEMCWAYL